MHCKNSAFCIVRHKYTYLHATKYCILCETQKHKPKPHFLASTLYALFALNWRISNPACSGVFVFLCSCCIEHVCPAFLKTAFYSCKKCILFFIEVKWVYNLIGSRKFNALLRELYSWSRIHIYGPLEYLNTLAFEHQNIWIFKHLNTKIFGYLSIWTPKYLDIYAFEHQNIGTIKHVNSKVQPDMDHGPFLGPLVIFYCVSIAVFSLPWISLHFSISVFEHFNNPQILEHYTQWRCNARHHIGNARCALQRECGLRTCRNWKGGSRRW